MWFFILFMIAIIVYIIWGINYNIKKNQTENEEEKQEKEKYNAEYSTKIKHVCGLPLTENTECLVSLCDNEIVVDSFGKVFRLKKSKIEDMSIKTSKEVQNSISGAVGGYVLLGPLGAFIGGTSTEVHYFFIIIYKDKNKEEKCISFDLETKTKDIRNINNYIENFKENIDEKEEIEL